jgi:hypothetical protein
MAGFIRRYPFFPGTELITQIEGVIIADLPAPGSVQGAGVGTAGIVGEFADMTYAVTVDTSGNVTTHTQPVEAFSAQDLINKVGGFDETLGEFGVSLGNGYQALRSKKFSRLILAPLNLASSKGVRYTRDLPLSISTTQANPVVPVSSATVAAGLEFRQTAGRVRNAKREVFTSLQPISTGTGGSCTSGGSAATQVFNSVSVDWTTIDRGDGTTGTYVGDVLVIGNNNAGAKQPSAEAGTYRVQTTPSSGFNVTVERMDGANFAFGSQTNVPWRLHVSSDADTAPVIVPGATTPGGYNSGSAGGYTVPTRPLTNASGVNSDGIYAGGSLLTPALVPAATTGSSWDPLGGLVGHVMPTGNLQFTAAVQGINPATNASFDALYAGVLAACDTEDLPARDINIIWTARKSANNRSQLKQHVLSTSQHGVGRMGIISPSLAVQDLTTVIGDSDPGVGGQRDERLIYTWPGAQTFVPEAVNFRIKTANSQTTLDGILDETFDSYYASVLSNLAPELNPGQAAPPIPSVLAAVLGLQRGVSGLGVNEYTQMRTRGVSALRIDRNVGPIIQSGITTALPSNQKNVNRRRFADFVEDSLSAALISFCKLPITNQFKDSVLAETVSFLDELLSVNNPAAQRIENYQVDEVSGNTPTLTAQGIFVIIVRVRMLATGDFIVLQAEVGTTVNIQPLAA